MAKTKEVICQPCIRNRGIKVKHTLIFTRPDSTTINLCKGCCEDGKDVSIDDETATTLGANLFVGVKKIVIAPKTEMTYIERIDGSTLEFVSLSLTDLQKLIEVLRCPDKLTKKKDMIAYVRTYAHKVRA
mgnify:CR=1 FL=1